MARYKLLEAASKVKHEIEQDDSKNDSTVVKLVHKAQAVMMKVAVGILSVGDGIDKLKKIASLINAYKSTILIGGGVVCSYLLYDYVTFTNSMNILYQLLKNPMKAVRVGAQLALPQNISRYLPFGVTQQSLITVVNILRNAHPDLRFEPPICSSSDTSCLSSAVCSANMTDSKDVAWVRNTLQCGADISELPDEQFKFLEKAQQQMSEGFAQALNVSASLGKKRPIESAFECGFNIVTFLTYIVLFYLIWILLNLGSRYLINRPMRQKEEDDIARVAKLLPINSSQDNQKIERSLRSRSQAQPSQRSRSRSRSRRPNSKFGSKKKIVKKSIPNGKFKSSKKKSVRQSKRKQM